ncbi:MAG TPA: hypothetical protein VK524_18390 [Polyangiaceae bacterium]|nr:hypothetical protein [Polyangiaceae bacterium]
MRDAINAWIRARNECAEQDLHRMDAAGAEHCGQHLLAELIRLRAALEGARGPVSGAEVIAHLAPIISLARGEAQDRLRAAVGDDSIEVPGIVSFRR